MAECPWSLPAKHCTPTAPGEAEEQKRQQEQDPTGMGRSQARDWGWPLVTTRGCRTWAVTAQRAQRGNDGAGKIRRNLDFIYVNLINDPGSLF